MGKKSGYKKRGNKYVPTEANEWRKEPGVDKPLRVGRGIRTRDEFLFEQTNKNPHPELSKEELYRRGVVLDMDDDNNLAIVKTHSVLNKQYPEIPNDAQRRRFEVNVHTVAGTHTQPAPISIKKGKFELAPSKEDINEEQAKKILKHIEKTSPKNKKRIEDFRKRKSRK